MLWDLGGTGAGGLGELPLDVPSRIYGRQSYDVSLEYIILRSSTAAVGPYGIGPLYDHKIKDS